MKLCLFLSLLTTDLGGPLPLFPSLVLAFWWAFKGSCVSPEASRFALHPDRPHVSCVNTGGCSVPCPPPLPLRPASHTHTHTHTHKHTHTNTHTHTHTHRQPHTTDTHTHTHTHRNTKSACLCPYKSTILLRTHKHTLRFYRCVLYNRSGSHRAVCVLVCSARPFLENHWQCSPRPAPLGRPLSFKNPPTAR